MFKDFLKYISVNIVFGISIYFGYFADHPVTGAQNIAMFMTWGCIVLSPLLLIDDLAKEFAKKPASFPWKANLDLTLDVLILAFLVWEGFIVTGVFYAIHTAIVIAGREKVNKLRKETENETICTL